MDAMVLDSFSLAHLLNIFWELIMLHHSVCITLLGVSQQKSKKKRERESEKIDDVLCGADNATMKSMR